MEGRPTWQRAWWQEREATGHTVLAPGGREMRLSSLTFSSPPQTPSAPDPDSGAQTLSVADPSPLTAEKKPHPGLFRG